MAFTKTVGAYDRLRTAQKQVCIGELNNLIKMLNICKSDRTALNDVYKQLFLGDHKHANIFTKIMKDMGWHPHSGIFTRFSKTESAKFQRAVDNLEPFMHSGKVVDAIAEIELMIKLVRDSKVALP